MGELTFLISIKKKERKMDKKTYLTPEMEEYKLLMKAAVLTASDPAANTEEPEPAPGGKLF